MKFLVILCAIIAAANAMPQHQQQPAAAVPQSPTFFFTSPVASPAVFALSPPALPNPASVGLAAGPVAGVAPIHSAQGAASATASAAGAQASAAAAPQQSSIFGNQFQSQAADVQAAGPQLPTNPINAPILPADLARAYTESNLRLAQAYREAEIRLAAANQRAAQDALTHAIAGANAAAAAGEKPAAAPVAEAAAPAAQDASAVAAGQSSAAANSGLVLPLGFQGIPISILQHIPNQQVLG